MCELTARNVRGTAWARHAMCESAFEFPRCRYTRTSTSICAVEGIVPLKRVVEVYLILLLFGNSTQRLNQIQAVGAILNHFYPLRQNIRRKMKRWMEKQHLALWHGPCSAQRQAWELIFGLNLAIGA